MVLLAVDLTGFEKNLAAFTAASGREVADVLQQQVKLFAEGVLHRTPPFGTFSGQESFGAQKRVGDAAVAGQIRTLFAPIDRIAGSLTKSPRLKTQFERAVETRDRAELEYLATRVLRRTSGSIIDRPTTALHNRWRDRRGRVRVRRPHFYVLGGKREIDAFVRLKQKQVGRAKAGWVAGALSVGARGIPLWISRHPQQGFASNRATAEIDPSITMRNPVPYIGALENQVHMTQQALRDRSTAMARQVEAKLRGLWGRRRGLRAA